MVFTDYDFHSLRHTHSTDLYTQGASLFDIKDKLGHCDIKTTMRYTHDNDKQKEVTANIIESIYCENLCPPK